MINKRKVFLCILIFCIIIGTAIMCGMMIEESKNNVVETIKLEDNNDISNLTKEVNNNTKEDIGYKTIKALNSNEPVAVKQLVKEDLNNKPIKRDLKQFEGKKLVAFTFDDGPNDKTTNRLLDNLDKFNARVTFFVVGNRISSCEETLARAYNMGNQIGSHTYSHSYLTELTSDQIKKEVEDTNAAIEKVIGVKPTALRPPYGSINSKIRKIVDMTTILWDVDTMDWQSKNTDKIMNVIRNNVHDGAIILFHDIYETSIDGALIAMEELQNEDYAFVTIDEMIELKQVQIDKTISYRNFK